MKATGPFAFLAKMTVPDPYTAAVQADTPTGWYRLNEGSGQILTDSSGHGRHGRWMPELADVKTTTGLIAGSDSAVSLPARASSPSGRSRRTAMPSLKGQSIEFLGEDRQAPPAPRRAARAVGRDVVVAALRGRGQHPGVGRHERVPGRRRLHHRRRRQPHDGAPGDRHDGVRRGVLVLQPAPTAGPTTWSARSTRPPTCCASTWTAIDRAPFNNFVGTHQRRPPRTGRSTSTPRRAGSGSCVMDELAFYNTELSATQVGTHLRGGRGAVAGRHDRRPDRPGAHPGRLARQR
jgi:hypothetical protein